VLSGELVRRAPTVNEELLQAMTQPVASLAVAQPDLPNEVVELVDRALAFEPSDRWGSALEMQQAVRDAYQAITGMELTDSRAIVAESFQQELKIPDEPFPLVHPRVAPIHSEDKLVSGWFPVRRLVRYSRRWPSIASAAGGLIALTFTVTTAVISTQRTPPPALSMSPVSEMRIEKMFPAASWGRLAAQVPATTIRSTPEDVGRASTQADAKSQPSVLAAELPLSLPRRAATSQRRAWRPSSEQANARSTFRPPIVVPRILPSISTASSDYVPPKAIVRAPLAKDPLSRRK
jgi:hypothetical protein